MVERRTLFRGTLTPLLLVTPQLLVTLVFFLWPAAQAVEQSVWIEDPFDFTREFVGLDNYRALFRDPLYLASIGRTMVLAAAVAGLALVIALVLALAATRVLTAALAYRSLLIWPYAVAPALAGVLWVFLMTPSVGVYANWLGLLGIDWNHDADGNQALILVVAASVWKQISYNFLFFLVGLQSIPRSLIEAAAIDRAGPVRRLFTITLPLLSPVTFFLLVINLVYAFLETFATIHATTSGGPGQATTTMVYKVYQTGFVGQDHGSAAAQSVVLMVLLIALTALQFRYIEKRVVY